MTDLRVLLERVEGASGPDRKLDALLEIVARKAEAFRVLPDPRHHAVWTPMRGLDGAVESQGTRYAVEGFTASLDAALALAERVLPGWMRFVGDLDFEDRRACATLATERPPTADYRGFAPPGQYALSVCAAILRAKLAEEEQGSSVARAEVAASGK